MDNGYCAPQNTFMWGFSLILLFLFLAITFVFCVLIYVVWIIHLRSTYRVRDQSEKVFGDLRTAFTVVQSIQDELGAGAAGEMSEGALKNALRGREATLRLRRHGLRGRGGDMGYRTCRSQPNADYSGSLRSQTSASSKESEVFWKEIGVSPTHSPSDKSFV